MNSFELNKIFMGILGACFLILSVNLIADSIFSSHKPEKPGYAIAASEAPSGGGEAAKPAALEPIGPLLAKADPAAGEKVAKKCASCHDFTKGGPNKVGPNLYGVVNAKLMHKADFAYSKGMQAFAAGKTWTFEELNAFLDNPKKLIAGTAMGFAGLPKAEDRANIIAYLNSLSDSPAPLTGN